MAKLEKFFRTIPGLYQPRTNPNVRGLLYAWSEEDDLIVQAVKDAKEQLFVKYAQLQYLDALGSNVGVFRPTAIGLADEQYRQLIPALSFYPKQVKPTIQKILDVFFEAGNPNVFIAEVNPNEIVIQIPSSVPALRRTLRGSHHFHNYNGTVVSVDNVFKEVVVQLDGDTKSLEVDEVAGAILGQDLLAFPIQSNTVGGTPTLTFSAGEDLSSLQVGGRINMANVANYQGSFFPDPTASYSITGKRGIIGQAISAGSLCPTLTMQDASGIPDAPGRLVFNFGRENEEADIAYFGRPNNTTLLIDASYEFQKAHSIGEVVNVMVKPYVKPAINGKDLSIFFVGVTAARVLAQQIVESVVAAGVVVRWIVVEPTC